MGQLKSTLYARMEEVSFALVPADRHHKLAGEGRWWC